MLHLSIAGLFMILSTTAFAATLDLAGASKMMMKSACIICHTMETTRMGPAYREVARRYANPTAEVKAYLKGEAAIDYLMKKVRTGTKPGVNKNWLQSPEGKTYGIMTPNPPSRISDQDLRDLLTFILSLR